MQWLGTITNALGLTKKSNPQSSSVNLQKVVAHNPSNNATRINMNRKTNNNLSNQLSRVTISNQGPKLPTHQAINVPKHNNLEEVVTQEGGKRRHKRRTHKKKATKHHKRKHTRKH